MLRLQDSVLLEFYCICLFYRFDVALLRLHRPVRYKTNILPLLQTRKKKISSEVEMVAGWGKLTYFL
jgi:hypothetical protein